MILPHRTARAGRAGRSSAEGLESAVMESRSILSRRVVAFIAAMLVSLGWVMSYRYHYNIEALNSGELNWWALMLWWLAGIMTLRAFEWLRARGLRPALRIVLLWLGYMGALLSVEYLGYHVLGIREVGAADPEPLVLDLVHGSKIMHAFYLAYPLILIAAFEAVRRVLRRVQDGFRA